MIKILSVWLRLREVSDGHQEFHFILGDDVIADQVRAPTKITLHLVRDMGFQLTFAIGLNEDGYHTASICKR